MQIENDIEALDIRIVWVLEQNRSFQAGTADSCRTFVRSIGSMRGLCVGDGQTEPTPGVFDNSPFSVRRGFDMLVRRSDMQIVWTTNHGTPGGNDNLSAAELLMQIRAAVGR